MELVSRNGWKNYVKHLGLSIDPIVTNEKIETNFFDSSIDRKLIRKLKFTFHPLIQNIILTFIILDHLR